MTSLLSSATSAMTSSTSTSTSTTAPPPPPTDARSLPSWESAFAHPLPTVRALEQQLRTATAEHRDALRGLVGARYRDLLGTAARIVEMDGQIRAVDDGLGELARKCHARRLEGLAGNYARIAAARNDGGGSRDGDAGRARLGRAAGMKVLGAAVAVAGRIVRKGGDALLVAKLVVLARLLVKMLGEGEEEVLGLEEVKKRLASTRKRLLSYIARTLGKADANVASMTNTLTAYALVSTSSPRDVLKYFLSVRFEQVAAETETATADGVLRMLELYKRTLSDTKAIFPRKLADSALQLGYTALVKDAQVRGVYELGLDVHEQWIAEDVRNFTPWVRHEQLTSSNTNDALLSWTKQAQVLLLQAIEDALVPETDAQIVVSTRQKVLTAFLTLSSQTRGAANQEDALEQIREKFLLKLESLIATASRIPDLDLTASPTTSTKSPSIWALAQDTSSLQSGAFPLRAAVVSSYHGRDASVTRIASSLDTWLLSLSTTTSTLTTMRSTKWDDATLDLVRDDDDDDTFADPAHLSGVLSKADPARLEAHAHKLIADAVRGMHVRFADAAGEEGASAPFLLRALRELEGRRRALVPRVPGLASVVMDESVSAGLRDKMAERVLDDMRDIWARGAGRKAVYTSLWDGGLPVAPSKAAWRSVLGLQRGMEGVGGDVWSVETVAGLKSRARGKVVRQLEEALARQEEEENGEQQNGENGVEMGEDKENDAGEGEAKEDGEANGQTNGNAKTDSKHTQKNSEHARNVKIQRLFDAAYLQQVLASTGRATVPTEKDPLAALITKLASDVEELDELAILRLRKNASEYWKKTYLLFGLLAPGRG